MRHLPTSRDFECGGSKWGEDSNLLLYTRDEIITKGEKPDDGSSLVLYTTAELFALEFEPYQPHEIVRAEDCILLSRWPVVCCRPSRRSRKTSERCLD